jgi:hypothetical protein
MPASPKLQAQAATLGFPHERPPPPPRLLQAGAAVGLRAAACDGRQATQRRPTGMQRTRLLRLQPSPPLLSLQRQLWGARASESLRQPRRQPPRARALRPRSLRATLREWIRPWPATTANSTAPPQRHTRPAAISRARTLVLQCASLCSLFLRVRSCCGCSRLWHARRRWRAWMCGRRWLSRHQRHQQQRQRQPCRLAAVWVARAAASPPPRPQLRRLQLVRALVTYRAPPLLAAASSARSAAPWVARPLSRLCSTFLSRATVSRATARELSLGPGSFETRRRPLPRAGVLPATGHAHARASGPHSCR